MEILYPVGILILSILLGALFLKQVVYDKKIKVAKLIFAGTLIISYSLIIFVFYEDTLTNELREKVFKYIYFATYLLIGVSFALNSNSGISKKYLNSEYYKCLESEKLFVLIDKNDRIKDASKLLQDNFSDDKKIIGKKFMDVFSEHFTLAAINDQPFKNEDLEKIFNDLKKETKTQVIHRELKVYKRSNNKPFVLRFDDHIIAEGPKFKGHILIGTKRSGNEMLEVEEKLESSREDLDTIRLRFRTELELTNEAFFFYNINEKSYWINDICKEALGFNKNSISLEEFTSFIHKDDYNYFLERIKQLKADDTDYEIKYRFKTGFSYSYVEERGRLLLTKKPEIMGFLEVFNSNRFQHTGKAELDNLKDEDDMRASLNRLLSNNQTFQVVLFRFNTMEEINEEHGRKIGNYIMGQYVKMIEKNFVDDNEIYRVSGLEFIMFVTDPRKMQLLKHHLEKGTLLEIKKSLGSSKEICLKVSMGIVESTDYKARPDMIKAAYQCLKLAKMDQVKTDYVYYKDLM